MWPHAHLVQNLISLGTSNTPRSIRTLSRNSVASVRVMGFPFVDVRTTFKGIPCSYPQAIRTDNGPEFTCRVFMAWMRSRGVEHIAFPRLHTLRCIEAKAKYPSRPQTQQGQLTCKAKDLSSIDWCGSRGQVKAIVRTVTTSHQMKYIIPEQSTQRNRVLKKIPKAK